MLRIVPHTVPRVGRSYEHFPDGFELHLLPENVNSLFLALSLSLPLQDCRNFTEMHTPYSRPSYGPTVVLAGGAAPGERGSPVPPLPLPLALS